MPSNVSKTAPRPVTAKAIPPKSFDQITLLEKIRYIASKLPIPKLQYKPEGWKPTWIEHVNTERLKKLNIGPLTALTAARFVAFALAITLIVAAVTFTLPYLTGGVFAILTALSISMTLTALSAALLAGCYHLGFILLTPQKEQDFSWTQGTLELAEKFVKESRETVNPFEAQNRADREKPEELEEGREQPVPPPPPPRPEEPAQNRHVQAEALSKQLAEARKISQEKFEFVTDTLRNETVTASRERNPAELANPLAALAAPHPAHIEVVPATSFQLAQHLVREGQNPAILNMANPRQPGGGQEGRLCSQSNLQEALIAANKGGLYPIAEFGVLTAPKVTFFKDDQNQPIQQPFEADVISSAAYDCRPNGNKPADEVAYTAGMKNKIKAMLRAAALNKNDSVVLSAFGCGTYRNNPEVVSRLYQEILADAEFQGRFKGVYFAIPEADNSPNLQAFQARFPAPAN